LTPYDHIGSKFSGTFLVVAGCLRNELADELAEIGQTDKFDNVNNDNKINNNLICHQ
jgi:hypothetical protein